MLNGTLHTGVTKSSYLEVTAKKKKIETVTAFVASDKVVVLVSLFDFTHIEMKLISA
jgi:hypothetical protein